MTRTSPVLGILPVDKPVGPTSHDVVGAARRAVGRGLEPGVPRASPAPAGNDDARARRRQVGEQRLLVLGQDLGADRQRQDHVLAPRPGAVGAHAVVAALGTEVLAIAEVDQGVEAVYRLDDHVAAFAAVAAIGAAEFY